MSSLQSKYRDEHAAIWVGNGVVVAHFYGEVFSTHITVLIGELDKAKAETGRVAYLSILDDGATAAPKEHRETLLTALNGYDGEVHISNWVTARGFKGAIFRSILTAMTLVLESPRVAKVFGDREKACEWLMSMAQIEWPAFASEVLNAVHAELNAEGESFASGSQSES